MTTHSPVPQRLYLMQVVTWFNPEAKWPIPYPCYLVQMSDGRHILIDTGWPEDLPARPGLQAGKNVVEQLALLDLQPADITMLICTHFDLDHAGHHSTFTQAELIVQRQHYELARSGYPRFASARPMWDHPDLRYRLVEGDTELLPGIELIETHGHVRGHQSVLVRLPHMGPVLLTIDAVTAQSYFTPDRQPHPLDDDQGGELGRAGARKLIDVAEREQVALVIFGHDGQQWPTLKKTPAYYQ
jgi:N-acyl homoserine lactone hydrolase